ncbi:esterase/lipase [Baekduia alba]|uniref:alpha/beta fold hydrolase n=1 Tax=Baekduia alba TaxID=2997333 RepID=UPI002340EB91|nr:alpha/beta fold hydrolase [Baekduia alba]WCB94643.1 esterase/lipase [Baekduia alba]
MAARPDVHLVRRGAGPPLVLLHGIGGEACVWDPVLDALAERHDVLALDLPGFGRSAPLPDGVEPSPAALAAAVAEVLHDLGLRDAVHVAGNSLGGWIALELAKAGRARSVTALCPAGLWGGPLLGDGETPVQGRGQRLAARLRPLIPVALRSRRVRHAVLAPFVAHPERVPYRDAWRMVSSYARATAYAATNVAMRRATLGDVSGIAVPVTVAFGERDRLIRPNPLAVPGARTVTLPDCGHIPMFDAPELVVEVIETTVRAGSIAMAR